MFPLALARTFRTAALATLVAAGLAQSADAAGQAPLGAQRLTTLGGHTYFRAPTDVGFEPWVIAPDGGAEQLASTVPGGNEATTNTEFESAGPGTSTVFFTSAGRLWKTDGTPAGTHELTGAPAYQNQLTVVGSTLYFSVGSEETDTRILWSMPVDGTGADAKPVDLGPEAGRAVSRLDTIGGKLVAITYDKDDPFSGIDRLLVGTGPGAHVLHHGGEPLLVNRIYVLNGRLYLIARTDSLSERLFTSDGTDAGTQPVLTGTTPITTVINGPIAGDGHVFAFTPGAILKIDGATATRVGTPTGGVNSAEPVYSGGKVYYGSDSGLTVNGLTGPGKPEVRLVEGRVAGQVVSAGVVYAKLASDFNDKGIYATDGTTAGTYVVAGRSNLPPYGSSYDPIEAPFAQPGGGVYFTGPSPTDLTEGSQALFRSSGVRGAKPTVVGPAGAPATLLKPAKVTYGVTGVTPIDAGYRIAVAGTVVAAPGLDPATANQGRVKITFTAKKGSATTELLVRRNDVVTSGGVSRFSTSVWIAKKLIPNGATVSTTAVFLGSAIQAAKGSSPVTVPLP